MEEELNSQIALDPIEIEILRQDGEPFKTTANAFMQLRPKPQFVFECTSPIKDISAIRIAGQTSRTNVIVIYSKPDGDKFSIKMTPCSPLITLYECAPRLISLVKFELLNFKIFIDHQSIEFGDWILDITPDPDICTIGKLLDAEHGYAVTHSCRLRKYTGELFQTDEAKSVLDDICLMLSFVRGAKCGRIMSSGFDDNGDEVWKECGTSGATPWGQPPNWSDMRPQPSLEPVFKGFWQQRHKLGDNADGLRMAMRCYLSSNGPGGFSVESSAGLIVSQAALERLAFQYFKNKGYVAGNIRSLIKDCKIDPEIPSCLTNLKQLIADNPNTYKGEPQPSDGPYAITALRNELIHPKRKLKGTLTVCQREAWNLAQWYIELVLLKIFGFSGQYGNRLIEGRSIFEGYYVPWSKDIQD